MVRVTGLNHTKSPITHHFFGQRNRYSGHEIYVCVCMHICKHTLIDIIRYRYNLFTRYIGISIDDVDADRYRDRCESPFFHKVKSSKPLCLWGTQENPFQFGIYYVYLS